MPITPPEASDLDIKLIEFVAHASNRIVSTTTRRLTALRVIDNIGVLLAGSHSEGIDALKSLAGNWSGAAQCIVPNVDISVPAPVAAWLAGTLAHALDYDDTHDSFNHVHSGTPVIAAALSIAQAYGPIGGSRFIEAVAVGQEVACRLSRIAHADLGWHRTSLFGSFGAAAAVAVLLGLSAEQVSNMFGIVLSSASGTRQSLEQGGRTKSLQAGQAASAGLTAALLAREGFTGPKQAFTGRFGLFNMYHKGSYCTEAAMDTLGTEWLADSISLKPYPCIRQAHGAIELAIDLGLSLKGSMGDVTHITLESAPGLYLPGLSTPRPSATNMQGGVENQFSVPYLIACALSTGRCGLAEVAAAPTPAIRQLGPLVRWQPIKEASTQWCRLTIDLADGRRLTKECSSVLGSPLRPLSTDESRKKFLDCADYATPPLTGKAPLEIWSFLNALQHQSDATAWLELLHQPLTQHR